MKNVFINSVLVVFALLVASCGRQPEAKVEVMSFNIRLDHVADSMNNWKYRKDHAEQNCHSQNKDFSKQTAFNSLYQLYIPPL